MPCTLIKSMPLAQEARAELKQQVEQLVESGGKPPRLVAFLANTDPSARKYAISSAKAMAEIGVNFELRQCTRLQLERNIMHANADDSVNGILVYYPVFTPQEDQYIQSCVSPVKDVEGLCHYYRYCLYNNIRHVDAAQQQRTILPCTPLAIVRLLAACGIYNSALPTGDRLHGRVVTIVNRSEIVGRPLAAMLANDGAKVYSVDVNDTLLFHRGPGIQLKRHETSETSTTLDEALLQSDIVISGVPVKGYRINTDSLKDGVVCVNFASFQNFDKESLEGKASLFVPSVGTMTVTMLVQNLLRATEYQRTGVQLLSHDKNPEHEAAESHFQVVPLDF